MPMRAVRRSFLRWLAAGKSALCRRAGVDVHDTHYCPRPLLALPRSLAVRCLRISTRLSFAPPMLPTPDPVLAQPGRRIYFLAAPETEPAAPSSERSAPPRQHHPAPP